MMIARLECNCWSLVDAEPVGVLSAAASEPEAEAEVKARATWQKMRAFAAAVGCCRGIWR
jgi:hypothetical protein